MNNKMAIIYIKPQTEKETDAYKKAKHEEFLRSFSDKEKMKRMKPKTIEIMGGKKIGTCPRCDHSIVEGDSFCDECFQRIDWS